MATAAEGFGTGRAGERMTLALIGAGHFLSHFYGLSLPPLFLFFQAEFGVSYALLGLIATGYGLIGGVLQAPVGVAVDRYGARPVLLAGLVLNAAAIAAIGFASGYWPLLALAIAAGIGNSVFHPADYAVLAARIDERRIGRAYSLHTFLGFFGTAVAPATMGALAAWSDWRTAVMVVGAVGLATAVVMLASGEMVGSPPRTLQGRAGGRARNGILTPPVLLFFCFFVAYGLASAGVANFTVIALGALHGLGPVDANLVLTASLMALAFGILAGGAIPNDERIQMALTATALIGAGVLLAAVAFADVGVFGLAVLMGLAGLGMGVVLPARDLMLKRITPPGGTGSVIGFVFVGLSLGGAVSPLGAGWLMDRELPALLFVLCGVFLAVAFLCAFWALSAARRERD